MEENLCQLYIWKMVNLKKVNTKNNKSPKQ